MVVVEVVMVVAVMAWRSCLCAAAAAAVLSVLAFRLMGRSRVRFVNKGFGNLAGVHPEEVLARQVHLDRLLIV